MFEAAVLVMTLKNGPMELRDEWGPYQSLEQCQDRTSEMQTAVIPMLAQFGIVAMKGKCSKNGDLAV